MVSVETNRMALLSPCCALVRSRIIVLTLAFLLLIAQLQYARAENHADYRYEDYKESDGRMHIQTHAIAFGVKLNSSVEVDGEVVYDAVSGATPNGGIPTAGSREWLSEIHPDVRKIGKHVIISPMLRYVDQSAADFYMTQLPGDYTLNDPLDPFYAPLPDKYSSDYRLAALQTITYGIGVTVKVHEHVSLDFALKRYEMSGKDSATSADLFPKANIVSIGARIWF